jgi:hypothetical protein
VVLAALVAACTASESDDGTGDEAIRQGERNIVGAAVPYPADRGLAARDKELASSIAARRAMAWKSLAKILKPVAIADTRPQPSGKAGELPLFRTWYGRDDFQRMFAAAAKTGSAEPGEPIADTTIDKVIADDPKGRGSWSEEDYLARVGRITDQTDLDGLGGNGRVTYSPGFVRHLISRYWDVYNCGDDRRIAGNLDLEIGKNFSSCFNQEFPADAAIIKTSWYRNDVFSDSIPVYRTDAKSVEGRLKGTKDSGGWGPGDGTAKPEARDIYTVKLSDGNVFRMPALHLVTKELRHWVWITIWWSDEPDTDFGADRPAEITALGGPWKNYKMCVTTDFEERDKDPTGGFKGSLGEALAAGTEGGVTRCSNPYIEKGAKNAQTNCIGCHQHAGALDLSSESVLSDEAKFPKAGRTKVRKNFITDYTFSLDKRPEMLRAMIQNQVEGR